MWRTLPSSLALSITSSTLCTRVSALAISRKSCNCPEVEVIGLHPPQGAFEVAARRVGVFRHGLGENEHVLAVFRA